uniref:Uncharacterized protein n=1 Tax=viral metagenome TaxID=1070528 RepID=A0A6C0CLV2_9ZZZZ
MEHIFEPNSHFDFSQLNCISPTALSGGSYFIRLLTSSQNPFYIQPPKCFTKSGIIKSGKKMLVDLVFQHMNESFLEFLESLEIFCQKKIFDNREKWFEAGLTMVDIENCFTCPTKSYKSGKFHILRSTVPMRMGKCNLKIFNEQEQDVNIEDIQENTNIMTILEIQGIRCSVRSFQLEFEVKQMMILKPQDNFFEKCLFKNTLGVKSDQHIEKSIKEPIEEPVEEPIEEPVEEPIEEPVKIEIPAVEINSLDTINEDISKNSQDYLAKLESLESDAETENLEEFTTNEVQIDISFNTQKNDSDKNEMKEDHLDESYEEVTLEVPENDIIKIKSPSESYYQMYKEAKQKAKIARDFAISSYLSAKQIKHQYLLDDNILDDEEMLSEEKELQNLELEEE